MVNLQCKNTLGQRRHLVRDGTRSETKPLAQGHETQPRASQSRPDKMAKPPSGSFGFVNCGVIYGRQINPQVLDLTTGHLGLLSSMGNVSSVGNVVNQ